MVNQYKVNAINSTKICTNIFPENYTHSHKFFYMNPRFLGNIIRIVLNPMKYHIYIVNLYIYTFTMVSQVFGFITFQKNI